VAIAAMVGVAHPIIMMILPGTVVLWDEGGEGGRGYARRALTQPVLAVSLPWMQP
jgi:hypothetical protein